MYLHLVRECPLGVQGVVKLFHFVTVFGSSHVLFPPCRAIMEQINPTKITVISARHLQILIYLLKITRSLQKLASF